MAIDWTMFKDPVTTISAILGAALGIFNFVQGFWQVRLKVIPKIFSIRQGAFLHSTNELKPNTWPCIEVVNLSNYPVTITEVGFTLRGDKGRAALFPTDVKKLPC